MADITGTELGLLKFAVEKAEQYVPKLLGLFPKGEGVGEDDTLTSIDAMKGWAFLFIGPTGVGKSHILDTYFGVEWNGKATKEALNNGGRIGEDEVSFIDTPGDDLFRDDMKSTIAHLIGDTRICVVNVCAFGYHAPANVRTQVDRAKIENRFNKGAILSADANGGHSANHWYRDVMMERERQWFSENWTKLSVLQGQIEALVTAVNKYDLWQMTDDENFDRAYGHGSFFEELALNDLPRTKIKHVRTLGGFDHFMGEPHTIKTVSREEQEDLHRGLINNLASVLS